MTGNLRNVLALSDIYHIIGMHDVVNVKMLTVKMLTVKMLTVKMLTVEGRAGE